MTKQKILIVEDSKPILQIHTHLVKKAGFEPITAETLSEVHALKDQLPEFFLAIIDYSLPDAPNGEAISYLLENKVPGIVMTGMLDDNTRNNILRQPVIDYITKESKQAYTYLHHLIEKLKTNNEVKVLIVDDSSNSRNYLQRLLDRHHYQVLQANCGKEAIEVLHKNPDIKLIITDKEMPNMDGLELCNHVRSTYSKDEISIIGLSGADNPSLTAKFIKNGANDFLKKPFCPEEFYCRILQNVEYIQSIDTIKKQANTDYLTGLFNRRYFFENISPIIKSRAKENKSSTLAMLDIDHFKSVNDTYGHDAGDEVLKAVTQLMKQHFENTFTVARIGGEEFCIFLDDTDIIRAETQLDEFRSELAELKIHTGELDLSCTISIGLTISCEANLDALINKADELLYEAKQQGRNRVVSD